MPCAGLAVAKDLVARAQAVRSDEVRRVFNEELNAVWRELFIRLAPNEAFVPAFALPEATGRPVEALLETHYRTGGKGGNPIVAMTAVADGSHLRFEDLMLFGGLVAWESLLVARFVASEGFDVMLDGVDVAGQGWVYQHYVRPARYGYKPIGYALTTLQQNGYGIGYIGAIADIRMSEKGELLSVALLNPERFLFDLKAKALPRRAGTSSGRPSFRTYGRERLGGVVALDGRSVANILVRTIDKAVFDDIRRLEQEDRA